MPDSTLRCLHHLREQFASLRPLGPLPAIVVELPAGSRVDQDAIRVAGQSLARCDAEWSCVIGCLDPAREGCVRVYAPARADTAWERFDGVSQDARRTASRLLVDAGILRAGDAELAPWIVDVARALESLDDADPCPARLAGGSARLWTPIGQFLTSEHTVRTPFPMFSEPLNGVTDVRYLVVRDATEASIAILDLLVGRLESVQAHDPDAGRRQKGENGRKPPRRRPGSGKPNGRPTKEADKLLRMVIQQITSEAREEGLNVGHELQSRVYSQTAETLCEMIYDRLRKKIAASTLRSSSKLWKKWKPLRNARGKPMPTDGAGGFDETSMHAGGAQRTADDRRTDAATARWAAETGVSLDD